MSQAPVMGDLEDQVSEASLGCNSKMEKKEEGGKGGDGLNGNSTHRFIYMLVLSSGTVWERLRGVALYRGCVTGGGLEILKKLCHS